MSTLLFIKVTDYVTSYFFIAIFLSGCYTMDKTDKGDSFQMGKKQVTFADIAAYTNFSKTTISRYFNHPDSLTLENQEKISQALDTLGYKKNKLAKVLANGKSEFIGIIIPNLYLHYYSEMLTQILSSYRDFHYKFLVFVSDNGPSEEEQYIDELMAYQIEGLIRDKCDVLIHVNADVPKSIPAYDRIRAFEDTCQEYHVPYELNLNVIGDSYQDIFAQMKHIFSDIDEKYPCKKKGIFLANDTYANMFLNLIFQKYGCFPDSYELVGFDNSPIASEAILPITTVGQQIDLIAKTAMELLVQQMEERKKRSPVSLSKPIHKQITPVLIRRDTTS